MLHFMKFDPCHADDESFADNGVNYDESGDKIPSKRKPAMMPHRARPGQRLVSGRPLELEVPVSLSHFERFGPKLLMTCFHFDRINH